MEPLIKTKSNRVIGIGLAIVGLLFVGINIYLIEYQNQYFPKLLCVGSVAFSLGIGLTIFPGGYVDMSVEKSDYWKLKWKRTALAHKLMWLLFSLAGGALCYFFFNYYGLSLV